ncbi:AAA family ATPase [Caulobacter segnis]|uniref:AAA family ATPase n=1 Tax=Caulobacter segnis TaxID=88688 RepID=A0A2W5V5U5_9CAUL|nr:ATP-binding protein [Caulobacter segnis]PZR30695.1 MAG: AAA family ATPase [Caulobacter segnis]
MPAAKQVIAMLAGHLDGDSEQVRTIALQIAAAEARQGHLKTAEAMKKLLARPLPDRPPTTAKPAGTTLLTKARSELEDLVTVASPRARLSEMTLAAPVRERLDRMVRQQTARGRLREHDLRPGAKLLLVGPPGSGKTLTASALAGELHLPLFTIRLEAVITRFLGESAGKLRMVFDQIAQMRGVYLFDEFDAIGGKRSATNDVGEARRILNSFLQFLEEPNATDSLIVAATNHPELLDRALVRRFDEIIEYGLPDVDGVRDIVKRRLAGRAGRGLNWARIGEAAQGLSQGEVSRAVEEALRESILAERKTVDQAGLTAALDARRAMREAVADLFNE